jgi:CHAT domain-containing protein/tetratricopeptide (TPR) repeat protein
MEGGRYQEALTHFQRALEISKKSGDIEGVCANLGNVGVVYRHLDKTEDALRYYEQAYVLLDRPGMKAENVAVIAGNLGELYLTVGRDGDAVRCLEKVLPLLRQADDQAGLTLALARLGRAYGRMRNQEASERCFGEALQVGRRLFRPSIFKNVLSEIGSFYLDTVDQPGKAVPYLEEALSMWQEKDHFRAIVLGNLGVAHSLLGDAKRASTYSEEALGVLKEFGDRSDAAAGLSNVARAYRLLGEYDKALACLRKAVEIRRARKEQLQTAAVLCDLGNLRVSIGRYEDGLASCEESLRIVEGKQPALESRALVCIGSAHEALGRYSDAVSRIGQAFTLAGKTGSAEELLASMDAMASVLTAMGDYQKAEVYLTALPKLGETDLRQRLWAQPDQRAWIRWSTQLGVLSLLQGKHGFAEQVFRNVEKTEIEKGYVGWGASGLAEVYLATGRHDEALKVLAQRVPRWNTPDSARILYQTQKGLAQWDAGDLGAASTTLLEAVRLSEAHREAVRDRQGFLASGTFGARSRCYRALSAVLAERALARPSYGLPPFRAEPGFTAYGKDVASSAFYFSEATKARTLLERMVATARRYDRTELPPELRAREERLVQKLSELEKRFSEAFERGEREFRTVVEERATVRRELETLIAQVRREFPRYAALHYPEPVPAEAVPLRTNEVLIEFSISSKGSYAFVVKPGSVTRVCRIAVTSEELAKRVNDFLRPLHNPLRRQGFSTALGHELYQLLLKDTLTGVPADRDIVIVPDGILGALPFEALVVEADSAAGPPVFVADRWRTSYVQSASVLTLLRHRVPSTAPKALFALGNPVYSQTDPRYIAYRGGTSVRGKPPDDPQAHAFRTRRISEPHDASHVTAAVFATLPETEREVSTIARLFGVPAAPPDVVTGVLANERQLRMTPLKLYRRIHFATHADLPGRIEGIDEPFMLLGQVENGPGADGFLTLSEVLTLDLDAETVVASACMTGTGARVEGEGVFSFARAFHHAGARNVVVSLWEVASVETMEFMELFYRHLSKGEGAREAITLARRETKRSHGNPFYWAAFLLHGGA